MEKRDYTDYESCNSRDFICDPFFQEWVIEPTAELADFWEGFLRQYPGATENVQVAKAFLQGIGFREHLPAAGAAGASFEKVMQELDARQVPEPSKDAVPRLTRRRWWTIAAAAVVTGIVLLLVWGRDGDTGGRIQHQTQYGKKEKVELPDGSTVSLNANSGLEYAAEWSRATAREVWLKGEAFFQVKRQQREDSDSLLPFRVHTGNLTVEVLGTAFDIRERRGITEVVLASGSIEVIFHNRAHGRKRLRPGDRLVYDPQKAVVQQDTTNATDYSAWQQGKLVLKDPSVEDIIRYLEDNYGYRIVLEDPRLATRKITGPIMYDSLNDALFILSTVLNTQVIKRDSTIILRPR